MYYLRPAAAFVRGTLSANPLDISLKGNKIPPKMEHFAEFFENQLYDLSEHQLNKLLEWGLKNDLDLHCFKATQSTELHQKIIHLLKGIQPDNFLLIGAKRANFVWKIVENFKFVSLTATEENERFFQKIQTVGRGGMIQLKSHKVSPQQINQLANFEYDVSLAIDLLNYTPDYEQVIRNICRLSRRFIILTFADKSFPNPDFKQFISEATIKNLLAQENIFQIRTETIANHFLIIARK